MATRKVKKTHSSPGIYWSEQEINYASKALGITVLGVSGETLKGPAFEPIRISNWEEFQSYFGGTSTAKFRGSQYPKYELPYIAQSYLKQSQKLEVVRVLGLSGVNAGPAWVITGTKHKTGLYKYMKQTSLTEEEKANAVLVDEIPTDEIVEKTYDIPECIKLNNAGDGFAKMAWDGDCADYGTGTPFSGTIKVSDKTTLVYSNGCIGEYMSGTSTYGHYVGAVIIPNEGSESSYPNAYISIVYDNDSDNYSSVNVPLWDIVEDTDCGKVVKLLAKVNDDNTYGQVCQVSINWDPTIGYTEDDYPTFSTGHYVLVQGTMTAWDESMGTTYDRTFVANADDDRDADAYKSTYKLYVGDGVTVLSSEISSTPTTDYMTYYCLQWRPNIQRSEEDDTNAYNNTVIAVLRSRGEHKQANFLRHPTDEDIANGYCDDIYEHDGIEYYARNIWLEPTKSLELGSSCNPGFSANTGDFTVDITNYGKFTIAVETNEPCDLTHCSVNGYKLKYYSVSLNPQDKNYIMNVIGGTPEDGDAEVYVDELYDVALQQLIEDQSINAINSEVVKYPMVYITPNFKSVNDLLTMDETELTKKYVGNRYLYSYTESMDVNEIPFNVHYSEDKGATWKKGTGIPGFIYTVVGYKNEYGTKEYFYGAYVDSYVQLASGETADMVFTDESGEQYKITPSTTKNFVTEYLTEYNPDTDISSSNVFGNTVKVIADDMYYIYTKGLSNNYSGNDVFPITLDFNNYREQFRYASTPWFVSEIKGSAEDIELNRLFRFHTISDGNASNTEIKVSIENIDPDNGTFDVLIRDYADTDAAKVVLERYTKCTLVPGTDRYLGLVIGTFDGVYETKSTYVTVEIIENDVTKNSVPCGFLGYPIRNYEGVGLTDANYKFVEIDSVPTGATVVEYNEKPTFITSDTAEYIYVKSEDKNYQKVNALSSNPLRPYFRLNTTLDEDVNVKKQYFGVSDITGIDNDMFSYKGVEAYNGLPEGLTPCFHLDSRILNGTPDENGSIDTGVLDESGNTIKQIVSVDGVKGYTWVTVDKSQTTSYGIEPRIGTEDVMENTIYEDKSARKFTCCFYGGWDGWDYYRTSRSNSDNFKYNKYKGTVNKTSGYGTMVNVLASPEEYGLDPKEKALTSDYYAYLAGARQFVNPNSLYINVLATPGIDYVNNKYLVQEVLSMVEEKRADAIYIVTTPDKPFGASDAVNEMYTAEEAVENLEDSDIDSNYIASYYPWYKYYDSDNNKYIFLPITRDVCASIALTDNVKFSWYAAAGWDRGQVSGVEPRVKLLNDDEDTLYDGRLNFIKSFAKEGDRIWGDKNMQVADGPMNRLSKRRLMLRIKELCKNSCIGMIFDPNDATCAKTFKTTVDKILSDIKSKRGITDYKIEVDDSAEARDRLALPATIFVKPVQLLEYIEINAVITPQSVDWE